MSKKVYKREEANGKNYEIKIINFDTGEYLQYSQHKSIGFVFGESETTTVYDMGYSSVNECIKKLKKRSLLGEEVDYKEQRESEKVGFINLGVNRIKRHNRINTRDFEDVINKLSRYGLNFIDAQEQIIGVYLYEIEQSAI